MSTTIIHDGASGESYVLTDSETEALQWALTNYGEDEVAGVESIGWMCEVPYPEDYESREEWEQSSDFNESWWEGCQPPVNDKQREHVKKAWAVRLRPISAR